MNLSVHNFVEKKRQFRRVNQNKILVYGSYSSPSNPSIAMSCEYNLPSRTLLRRPIGQKTARRKEKEKFVEMSTPKVKLNASEDDIQIFARDYARIEGEKAEIERKCVNVEMRKAKSDI